MFKEEEVFYEMFESVEKTHIRFAVGPCGCRLCPGLLFRQPDHFENYDDWPFLWGQNEGTIAGNTGYLIWGETFRNVEAK